MNLRASIDVLVNQWNSLKPREKQAMLQDKKQRQKLEKLRNRFYKQGKLKEGKEIISLFNKASGATGQALREANKLQHEALYDELTLAKDRAWFKRVREGSVDKKLRKIYEEAGLTANFHQLKVQGVPNPEVLKMGWKKFLQFEYVRRKRTPPAVVKADAKKKWDEAKREAKQVTITNIKDKASSYINEFLEKRFFANLEDRNKLHEMKAYIKLLPLKKIYDIEYMLTGEKFLNRWDSDQEADNYDRDWNDKRADLFLKLLRNETKKFLTWNDEKGEYDIKDHVYEGSHYTFENYM